MSLDITAISSALKEIYGSQDLESVVNKTSPLLTKLARMEDMGGKTFPLPVNYSLVQACSATFSVAQARLASTSSQFVEFQMTRVNVYSLASISGEALKASEKDMYAFVNGKKFELDAAGVTLGKRLGTAIYGQGWGELATIGAISGFTVTLTNAADIARVEVGQGHQFSALANTGALRAGGPLYVTAVNRNTGVVTYGANTSTITGLAVNDTIFTDGDRQAGASPTRIHPVGLAAWCPSVAPSPGENFFGVDRSIDTRLQGSFYDSTTGSEALEDGLLGGLAHMCELGGDPTDVFVNYRTFAKLAKTQRLNERYIVEKGGPDEAMFGFSSIKVAGPNGVISVWCDQLCGAADMWAIDMTKLELGSIGKAIDVVDEGDGLIFRADPTTDNWTVRLAFRGNLLNHAPNSVCRIKITPV